MSDRTAFRVCPFCEATCGLAIRIEREAIVAVRGDADDPFSHGFICPKAYGVKELYHDPDRLRAPVRRTASGWTPITWDEAYAEIASRLTAIRRAYGNDAIGMYSGNPVVHDLAMLYLPVLIRALDSHSVFNPAAVDTLPKIIQTGLMFGGPFPETVPIPDIDRTHYLLVVGANPAISHGSLMTMPDAPGRLKGVIARGGKLVVVDPRRTETAKLATEHHFIRPGTDAAFLLAMVHTLFDEGLVRLGAADGLVNGLEELSALARDWAPEVIAGDCGIPAGIIRRISREFADAKSAACYGRLGTCVQEFGTLASWGCDLVNIVSGNLDRPGGVMFPEPAAPLGVLAKAKPFGFGRWRSRVSSRPETASRIPSSAMAEEMLTPGPGKVRAMILVMANPLRSAANSGRLEAAFSGLDFLVAVDFYINETTRHAHIILPTPSPAEQTNYEFGLYHLAVRNVAKWSPAALPPPPGSPPAWEVLLRLVAALTGMADRPTNEVDDLVFRQIAGRAVANSALANLTVEEVTRAPNGAVGPERVIDLLLRLGPYGDGFGRRPGGLSLNAVREAAHGIDLGPLRPRLHDILNTSSGMVELAPATMTKDLERLRVRLRKGEGGIVLIGRRTLRTSNSFMHNLPSLVKGPDVCTLQVSRKDAGRLAVADGDVVRVSSRVGGLVAPVEVTDDIMPGVVSLPHGWGHDADGAKLTIAAAHPGVNTNVLTDDEAYDAVSGTTVLFGTPVRLERLAGKPRRP